MEHLLRLRVIELILSIKRNIRCVTVKSVHYEANNVTDIFFNCDLHDVSTLRHEMFYFYASQYIENDPQIEALGNYTAFEYQLFGAQNITLHFNIQCIDDEDDDRNDEDPNQTIPDWI